VLEIGSKVIQTFTGPILAIYLLGMFSRRARSWGVMVGGIAGTAVALYIAFQGDRLGITFIWPTVFGLITTIVVGYLASLMLPRPEGEDLALTWRQVMSRPLPDDVVEAQATAPAAAPAPITTTGTPPAPTAM
jgi:Na+/proline symporter